jgi:hypothetical protein
MAAFSEPRLEHVDPLHHIEIEEDYGVSKPAFAPETQRNEGPTKRPSQKHILDQMRVAIFERRVAAFFQQFDQLTKPIPVVEMLIDIWCQHYLPECLHAAAPLFEICYMIHVLQAKSPNSNDTMRGLIEKVVTVLCTVAAPLPDHRYIPKRYPVYSAADVTMLLSPSPELCDPLIAKHIHRKDRQLVELLSRTVQFYYTDRSYRHIDEQAIEARLFSIVNTIFFGNGSESLKVPLDDTYIESTTNMRDHLVAFIWHLIMKWSQETTAFAFIFAWRLTKRNAIRRAPLITFLLLHMHELEDWQEEVAAICQRVDRLVANGGLSKTKQKQGKVKVSCAGTSANAYASASAKAKGGKGAKVTKKQLKEEEAKRIDERMEYLYLN